MEFNELIMQRELVEEKIKVKEIENEKVLDFSFSISLTY